MHLLTGIPRSGTTLCCKLLNQRSDSIALHEPINPSAMSNKFSSEQAMRSIQKQIAELEYAIQNGLPFNHGDKGGLDIDNPVGHEQQDGVRKVVAQRGQIQIPPRATGSYQLIVKQNALFTALLPELKQQYQMICIVRNPVDVLLSWMTVNLPVNRGRIPAGERFDKKLKNSLDKLDCIHRQLFIYQWFVERFLKSGLSIVRYEDVISSSGKKLDQSLGLQPIQRPALFHKNRTFQPNIISALQNITDELVELNCGELYSKNDILDALKNLSVGNV